jgi:hypothetical protein
MGNQWGSNYLGVVHGSHVPAHGVLADSPWILLLGDRKVSVRAIG